MSNLFGEARIAVVPDTTAFRTLLIEQIEIAKKGVFVNIPVTSVGAEAAAAQQAELAEVTRGAAAAAVEGTAAADAETAALRRTGAAATLAARQQQGLAEAAELNARSVARLAGVEEAASLTTTELAAARARLREVNAAAVLSQEAFAAAVQTGDIAMIEAQANITRLIVATRELAVSDVKAIIAEGDLAAATAARGRAEAFAARGAGASALQLVGLRGATLAANAAFIAGAAGAITFAKSVKLSADLEKQLNVLQATTGATAEEMKRVSEAARALGSDIALPAVSASDAAVAMTELAKAGLTVQDSIAGARGTLLLATAAQIDNAAATEIVANALNQFALSGQNAVRVADLLAAASIEAQGDINDFGAALTNVGGVSRQVGISIEDTVALLTILAKNGIQGASAGTVLRVALLRLVAPASDARKELEKLNVAIRDQAGNIRPEVFADLDRATQSLTASQRDFALQTIFGTRGIRAQVAIGREGTSGLERYSKAVQQAGEAQQLADAQTKGLSGQVEGLKNQLEEAGITIGNIAKGPLKLLVAAATADVTIFNAVASSIGKATAKLNEFSKPAQDVGTGFFHATQSVGTFLDRTTEGIPVLDGFFETLNKGKETTDDAAAAFDRLAGSVDDALNGLAEGLKKASAAADTSKTIATTQSKLGLEIARAEASGDQARLLADLRKREANQQRFIARLSARPQDKQTVKTLTEANQQLAETRADIQRILDQRKTDAEQAARDIADSRSKADQAIIDAFSGPEAAARRRIERAGRTDTLRDDIAAAINFRNVIKKQIKIVRKSVQDAKTKSAELRTLANELASAVSDIISLRAQVREQETRERRERIERFIAGTELDIELADINENTRRRIALREKLIKQLLAERKKLHLTGNALKENRNEIARIRKEIEEIQKETKKTGEAGNNLQKMQFEFLQTQSGFAANLLGNLIPGGATAGLVGGTATGGGGTTATGQAISGSFPGALLPQEHGRGSPTAGLSQKGPTRIGQSRQTQLLIEIRNLLKNIYVGTGHPHAHHRRGQLPTNFDLVGS